MTYSKLNFCFVFKIIVSNYNDLKNNNYKSFVAVHKHTLPVHMIKLKNNITSGGMIAIIDQCVFSILSV